MEIVNYMSRDIFLDELKYIWSIKFGSIDNIQIPYEKLEKQIKELESEKISIEKIIIVKILRKKVNWIDFLWIFNIHHFLNFDDAYLKAIWLDSDENAMQEVLRIIENYDLLS